MFLRFFAVRRITAATSAIIIATRTDVKILSAFASVCCARLGAGDTDGPPAAGTDGETCSSGNWEAAEGCADEETAAETCATYFVDRAGGRGGFSF